MRVQRADELLRLLRRERKVRGIGQDQEVSANSQVDRVGLQPPLAPGLDAVGAERERRERQLLVLHAVGAGEPALDRAAGDRRAPAARQKRFEPRKLQAAVRFGAVCRGPEQVGNENVTDHRGRGAPGRMSGLPGPAPANP